jgi:AMMECR1 domain-containing protein
MFPSPTQPSRTLSATYLPEVAPEQGWNQEEAVLSAIAKAGYRGRVKVGDEIWKSLKVKAYGSVKAEVDWEGYQAWMVKKG